MSSKSVLPQSLVVSETNTNVLFLISLIHCVLSCLGTHKRLNNFSFDPIMEVVQILGVS